MDKATNLQTAPLMGSWKPDGYQDWLPSYWWGLVIMVGGLFISPLNAGLWGVLLLHLRYVRDVRFVRNWRCMIGEQSR